MMVRLTLLNKLAIIFRWCLYTARMMRLCAKYSSSLGLISLRWFNGLRKGSINNFGELIQEFKAQFMTHSWVPQPMDALLSMKMGVGETL